MWSAGAERRETGEAAFADLHGRWLGFIPVHDIAA